MLWEKNEDYWQEGKPYLDGIEVKYVPDSVTASAMMQAGEADMWTSVPVLDQQTLEKQGFIRQEHPLGSPTIIYFDVNKNPDSPFQDLRVREAVEYALDRPTIAEALGLGYYTPLLALNGPSGWGYDPNYEGRPYNPDKARELLAAAGHADGLKVKMLVQTTNTDLAEAIKRYLDDVGMEVDLDMADPGRFFASVWVEGWEDMCLFISGADPDPLMAILVMFGPHPMNMPAGFHRSPELLALGEEALKQYDEAGKIEYTKKLARQIADEVALCPLYLISVGYMIKPYVHTTYLQQMSVARRTYDEWMDPH
jgi:peptide/nickel transport system substrate-binding protein